ncbi:MAG: hypothetical protein QM516_10230 [Limnohabitans sp.]|jgi:hypothetical protein|nr:hypothetical protein [Limnohabitans sp.]
MTACNASFSYIVEPQRTSQVNDRPTPCVGESNLIRPWIERLAARISSGLDEVVPFTTPEAAVRAISSRFLRGRRIGRAITQASPFGLSTCGTAGANCEVDLTACTTRGGLLPTLISCARDVDVLIVETPQRTSSGVRELLTPRELLELRARSPKTLLILDLVNEDLAKDPLTQAALLLPGTIALRGFGALWAAEGAKAVADTAFVFGAPPLVSTLARDSISLDLLAQVVADFDSSDIDRRVQCAARLLRERYTVSPSRV